MCTGCADKLSKPELIALVTALQQENAELWTEYQRLFDEHWALIPWARAAGWEPGPAAD